MSSVSINASSQDLAMAYRKAKADLFYSPRCCREKLLIYETNLKDNINSLQARLKKGKTPKINTDHWSLIPKKLDLKNKDLDIISSDPAEQWKTMLDQNEEITAEFRLMEDLPVEFHVFATYWIMKVGQKLDAKLGDYSYGNRLRREAPEEGKSVGQFNLLSLGSNPKYLSKYREWQDKGLTTIEKALEEKKAVVAITADVSGFYHNLCPSFLVHKDFYQSIGMKFEVDLFFDKEKHLTDEELLIHELFVEALVKWGESTPLGKGLPVGLVASSLIANLALYEFDTLIKEEVCPLYYGRYVDDIILVIENTKRSTSSEQVWKWISERFEGKLSIEPEDEDGEDKSNSKQKKIVFSTKYLEKSIIEFKNEKNKIFSLSGATGKNVLQNLRTSIQERTSEWRSLPDLSENLDELETKIVTSIYDNSSDSSSLRTSDEISIKRASFAIQLSSIEAYSRFLHPKDWRSVRHAFLDVTITHVFCLPHFFSYFNYLTRIIRLALHCGDYGHVKQITKALESILQHLNNENVNLKIATGSDLPHSAQEIILSKFKTQLQLRVTESLNCVGLAEKPNKSQVKNIRPIVIDFLEKDRAQTNEEIFYLYRAAHKKYHQHDLGYLPFKEYLMGDQTKNGIISYLRLNEKNSDNWITGKTARTLLIENVNDEEDTGVIVLSAAQSYFESLNISDPQKYSLAMLFPTRPFNVHDLYLFIPKPFTKTNSEYITKILLAHRGFKSHNKLPLFESLVKSNEEGDLTSEEEGKLKEIVSFLKKESLAGDDTKKELIQKALEELEKSNIKKSTLQKLEIANGHLESNRIRFAVSSWNTPRASWVANVVGKSDPHILSRLTRFCSLFNQVMKLEKPPRYLVLPELSMPPAWFNIMALKLIRKGIHLIAGVEYSHNTEYKTVVNQVWAALSLDTLDFPVLVPYIQDKQRPAIHEETNLYSYGGKRMVPSTTWEVPPIIQHGDFYFSLLICSEFTNINNRAPLAGRIDALIIPEWNQDTDNFNALVESSAGDIHAYIIQCNDRSYGDSRIRVPAKERYERDMIRIKGGLEDYFVVGEINVKALRQFQSRHISPNSPFKPVPDGFKIADYRKTLPK